MKATNEFRETNSSTFSDATGASLITVVVSVLALIIAIMNVKLAFAFMLVVIIHILSMIRYKQQRNN